MSTKFPDSFADLIHALHAVGRTVKSSEDKGNMWQMKTETGETVNLYKTGTLQIQGPPALKARLKKQLEAYLERDQEPKSLKVIAENKRIVERFYSEIWEQGKRATMAGICHSDMVFRGSLGDSLVGVGAFWEYVCKVRGAFEGYYCKIQEMVGEGNKVFCKMVFGGVNTGELLGYEPTGDELCWSGSALFEIRGGRITNLWVLGDVDSLKEELQEFSKS